jgi:hypothetical protein
MTASSWLHLVFMSLPHADANRYTEMHIMSLFQPSTTDNPEQRRGRKWRGPNVPLLSVAFALAITVLMAAPGTFPSKPYSNLLLLALAAALFAVLEP